MTCRSRLMKLVSVLAGHATCRSTCLSIVQLVVWLICIFLVCKAGSASLHLHQPSRQNFADDALFAQQLSLELCIQLTQLLTQHLPNQVQSSFRKILTIIELNSYIHRKNPLDVRQLHRSDWLTGNAAYLVCARDLCSRFRHSQSTASGEDSSPVYTSPWLNTEYMYVHMYNAIQTLICQYEFIFYFMCFVTFLL